MSHAKLMLPLGVLLAVIAGSYLTLGIAAPGAAADLWFPYAITEFSLALVNILVLERRLPNARRSHRRHATQPYR